MLPGGAPTPATASPTAGGDRPSEKPRAEYVEVGGLRDMCNDTVRRLPVMHCNTDEDSD